MMSEKWKTSTLPPKQMKEVLNVDHPEYYVILAATELRAGTSITLIKGDFSKLEVPKEWFISGSYEVPDFEALEIIDWGQALSFGSYEVGFETILNEFDLTYRGRLHQKPFIVQCIEGTEDPESIEDYVDRWHKKKIPWKQRDWTLADFLGITDEAYQKWVDDDSYLMKIINGVIEEYG